MRMRPREVWWGLDWGQNEATTAVVKGDRERDAPGPVLHPETVLILNLLLPGLADKAQDLPPQTLPLSILVRDPPHGSSWVSSSPYPCLSLIPGLRS